MPNDEVEPRHPEADSHPTSESHSADAHSPTASSQDLAPETTPGDAAAVGLSGEAGIPPAREEPSDESDQNLADQNLDQTLADQDLDDQNLANQNLADQNLDDRVWQAVESGWSGTAADLDVFHRRFREHFLELAALFARVYSHRDDWEQQLTTLVSESAASWADRAPDLEALDAAREADPDWFQSEKMLGGVCYVDRFAGDLDGIRAKIPYFQELGLTYLHLMPLFLAPHPDSDGGYAVSSYRDVNPNLGTMSGLRELAAELRAVGISLVVDFIFNHTSNEHEWAQRALAGEKEYEDYYWIFPDRTMPDAYERTVREIFPDDHPGSFVRFDDGRWVWATFYHFQWDLNYANPAVFRAMAREMLFLANIGIDILRMDAVAFIWKQLGTACESLPMAHVLIQAFNSVCRLAAPSLLFKSEAIVHPDEVAQYIRPDECQLSYNPLQMALTWEALATRDTRLLSQALERRHAIPDGTTWVNYVRSHDDIGWTFSDEDAGELGIDGRGHRRFLNDFYVGRFEGSFARGVPFQENPRTGDSRVSGTTASLAGLEQHVPGAISRIHLAHSIAMSTGGIPLIYLGDEVGQLNDYGFAEVPAHSGDSRWVHRPAYPQARFDQRHDPHTDAGLVFAGLRRLIQVRRATPEFAGTRLIPFGTNNSQVIGYQRPNDSGAGTRPDADPGTRPDAGAATSTDAAGPAPDDLVLVLANFSDTEQLVTAETLSGFDARAVELTRAQSLSLAGGLQLRPHEFAWLRVRPARG